MGRNIVSEQDAQDETGWAGTLSLNMMDKIKQDEQENCL